MPITGGDPNGLHPSFASALNSMPCNVVINSGYRTPERQAQLYADYINGVPGQARAAPPGKSNHNFGLAVDLDQGASDMDCIRSHAAEYGLRFPMDDEPWHIEPIDLEALKAGQSPMQPLQQQGDDPLADLEALIFGGTVPPEVLTPDDAEFDEEFTSTITAAQDAADAAAGEVESTAPPAFEAESQVPDITQPVGTMQPAGGMGGGELDKFMEAIAVGESGGNYNAVNPDSGAFGKYQFMPSTWQGAASAAGINPADHSPQAQDAVARHLMSQYYNQFGNWRDVAIAWYAGPGAVGGSNGSASQGKYPTINSYADQVIKRMGEVAGTDFAPTQMQPGFGFMTPHPLEGILETPGKKFGIGQKKARKVLTR